MREWLSTFPTTNGRIFFTIVVFVLTGLVVAVRIARGHPMPDGYGEWWLLLGVAMGIDAAQFLAKRKTFTPSPPVAPDVEDAKAGADVGGDVGLPMPLVGATPRERRGSYAAAELPPRPDLTDHDDGVL